MLNKTDSHNYRIPVLNKEYFKDLHTMALVSLFPRSGSTLLGYLLTAHRNMVIANEPAKKRENLYNPDIPPMALLNYILYMDKKRFDEGEQARLFRKSTTTLSSDNPTKRTYNKQDRYIFVPNQWQARCDSLQVIGIKNSSQLVRKLLLKGTFGEFKRNLREAGIRRLKFVFTVRNPYDMIATGIVHRIGRKKHESATKEKIRRMLEQRMKKQLVRRCEMAAEIFELMKPRDIFLSRHEDLIADPVKQLIKLCDFLKVSISPDYLNDCISVIHNRANKSRHELEWSEEQKEEMKKIIHRYRFFDGYSWEH